MIELFGSNNYGKDGKNSRKNSSRNENTSGFSSGKGSANDETKGTVWDGDCYHGYYGGENKEETGSHSSYTSSSSPSGSFKSDSSGKSNQYNASYFSGGNVPPYRPYSSYQPAPGNMTVPSEKPKKHTLRRVLVGVLACLVVSAGSIAGFAALINNGTIKLQPGNSGAAFTIVKNASKNNTASAINTNTTTSGFTKQQVAQKVLPSVVCIENYSNQKTTTRGRTDRYSFGDDDAYNSSGSGNTDGSGQSDVSPSSEGSGIIMTADGYIITNAHVVSSAASLKVVLYNGKTYAAKLIGSDNITDLALVKINAKGLTAAEFGSSNDMQVADTVIAVGNPGGMEFNSSVTTGCVSALNRQVTNSETGYTMKCIQTDAAINPGNSGGPLVNMKGQVIGINSSKIVSTGYEGLGFAIPIDTAQPVITQLKQYGYVKDRAMLGIAGTYIDSMTAQFYGLSTGMYVASISSQYISAAGIQKGDVITKIDGKAVTNQNTISSVIASKKPGDTVTLTVSRSSTNKTFTASVKLTQATGKS